MTPPSSAIATATPEVAALRARLHPFVAVLVVLALLIALLAAVSNLRVLIELQGDRLDNAVLQGEFEDYVAFYAAGELVTEGRGGELYDIEAIAAKEQEIMGRPVGGTGTLGFFNPPFVAALYAPISLLPVGTAGVVLFALNSLLVLAVVVALYRMLNLHGFAASVLAVPIAISLNSVFWLVGHNQLSMLLVTGFLGFFWLQRQERPTASGFALTLLLVKPQMAVLPLIVLLWRRDWQALASFSAVAMALVLISLLVSGPAVLWDYPSFALSSTGWEMEHGINVERMYGWNGVFATLLPNQSLPHLALTTAATILTASLVLMSFRHAEPASSQFALAFAAMVAGAILINPHVYLQDLVLMALVVVGGYLGTRSLRWPAFLWVGIAALVWLAQETADRFFNAASVNAPSLLLVGLLFTLIWASKAVAKVEAEQADERLGSLTAA